MTRDDALALLRLAKRHMREGCGTPPVDSERIARRFVQVMSSDRDRESEALCEARARHG